MEWSYSGECGPEKWHNVFPAAGGKHQSPIDIQPEKLKVSFSYSKKKFRAYYHSKDLSALSNTGYSWQIATDNNNLAIAGGPLENDYVLVQVHAHWGRQDNEGSEHTINGKHYSGELHLVHWNKARYPTIEEAKKHPDGLCVLGVLLKVGKPHPDIQKIVDKIPDILHKGHKCKLDEPINPKTLLPKNLGYWNYNGSLTTPPCSECVIWIVFNDPIEISHEQLETFRTMRCHSIVDEDLDCLDLICEDYMRTNFRPTLPLGDRMILRSSSVTKSENNN